MIGNHWRTIKMKRWLARYCQTFLVVTVQFFLLLTRAEEWISLPKTSSCHCKGKQSPTAKCSTYTHWMRLNNHVILGGTPPTYDHFGDFQRLLDKWRWLKMFHSCPVYGFIRFMPKSMLCAIKINQSTQISTSHLTRVIFMYFPWCCSWWMDSCWRGIVNRRRN